MTKLWKKDRDAQGIGHLKEVDLSTLAISSPTIVFISGHVTRDNNPEVISTGFSFLEETLRNQPELKQPPQIYSWSHSSSLRTCFNIASYNFRPKRGYSHSAKTLAEGVIMPLVSDNGKPIAYEEAQKRLRNLTFFGYSAGSVVAQEAFNAAMKMMKKMGYKSDEARTLLHEVVLISIGTVSNPFKEKNRFTTLSLANSDDRFVRIKSWLMHPLKYTFSKPSRKLKINPMSDTSLYITAAASRRMRDRGKVSKETAKIDGIQLPRWHYSASNHDFKSYVNNDDKHSQVSRIVPSALINALNRKTTLDPLQLLEPTASLGTEEKVLYQSKITKAQVVKK